MRVNRNGFLQRRVLWMFGYYPWKCGNCGSTFLYRKRGKRHHVEQDVTNARARSQEQGEA